MALHRQDGGFVAAVILASAIAGGGQAQSQFKPTLNRGEATEGFTRDIARCLYSREHHIGIADLPADAKVGLRPATEAERRVFKDPAIKVWTTDLYGSLVLLAEISPEKCQVLTEQLPADETFHHVLAELRQADPALRDEPAKAGYWPFVYRVSRNFEASRITVLLEGSDPGGLDHPLRMLEGHAYRYSILMATIERTPTPGAAVSTASCKMTLPDAGPAMGLGTVQGVEDHAVSAARIVRVQQQAKGQIDPDYADTPRVLVRLDSGETHAVAVLTAMQPKVGDRVEVLGLARNSKLPCNYLPVRVGSIVGGPAKP